MSHDPVERVLLRLSATGTVKRDGAGWVACCPAHDDARPSLAIGRGRNGDALVFCRSGGCSVQHIVDALGMTLLDLKADQSRLQLPTNHGNEGTNGSIHEGVSPRGIGTDGFSTANAAAQWLKSKNGAWSRVHAYTNSAGERLGIIIRWDTMDADGKARKHFVPVWRFGSRWRIGCIGAQRPLYGLSELGSTGRVFIVEGEKCADMLHSIGVCATTSSFGARSAHKSCWRPLAGREAVLLPDADIGGMEYACEVKALLEALEPPARVRIVRLPGLRDGSKDDVQQWLENRHHGDADAAFAELQDIADTACMREGGQA
jgi:putative DNA primase/helicase